MRARARCDPVSGSARRLWARHGSSSTLNGMKVRGLSVSVTYWIDVVFRVARIRSVAGLGRTLSLPLLFGAWTSVSFAAIQECENGLLKPAARFFRALKGAVNNGSLPLENLRWMVEQPRPADPTQGLRMIGNLAFKNVFRREIPNISPDQWALVVAQARGMEQGKLNEHVEVRQNSEATRNIFSIIPSGMDFPSRETMVAHFVSKSGEPFIYSHDGRDAYIYNLAQDTKVTIKGFFAGDRKFMDFFEAAGGEAYVALGSTKKLGLFNMRTGEELFVVEDGDRLQFRTPIIYESLGVLSVVMGDKTTHIVEGNSCRALYNIRYAPGKGKPKVELFGSPFDHVVRLHDGHLYGRLTKPENIHLSSYSVVLRDLTLEKEVFEVDNLKLNMDSVKTALVYSDGPQLLVRSEEYYDLLDPTNKKLIPKNYSAGPLDFSRLGIHRGEAMGARFMQKARGGPVFLEITHILRKKVERIDVNFDERNRWNSGNESTFQTPNGLWIASWETHGNQEYARLHLYNVDTQALISIPVPPGIDHVHGLFYNPTDDRILMAAGDRMGMGKILQVYGPEAIR